MNDKGTGEMDFGMAGLDQIRRQAQEDVVIDKKSKLSSIQLAEFAEKQTKLLEKANSLAESAETRAQAAERQSAVAKRHSILANMIAVISLLITAAQYLSQK